MGQFLPPKLPPPPKKNLRTYSVHIVPYSLQEIVVRSPGHTGKSGPGGILSIEVELLAAVAAGVAGTDKEKVVDGCNRSRVALGMVGYVVSPAGSLVCRHNTEGQVRLK